MPEPKETPTPPTTTPAPDPSGFDWGKLGRCLVYLVCLAGGGLTTAAHLPGCAAAKPQPPEPPPIVVPAHFDVKAGYIQRIAAKTKGKRVTWRVLSFTSADGHAVNDGLEALASLPVVDPHTVDFSSPLKGRFLVQASTSVVAGESESADTEIINGDAPPLPPGPGPVPPPVPPAPPDPFTQALQAAFKADAAPDKATSLDQLAALYRQGAATAQDPALKTAGDLLAKLHAAADALLGVKLDGVRRAIADELDKSLPTVKTAVLDQAARDLAGKQFGRVADALGSLK